VKDVIVDDAPIDFLAKLYCLFANKQKDIHYIIDFDVDESYDVELLKNTNTIMINLTHTMFEEDMEAKMFIDMAYDKNNKLVLRFRRDE